MSLQEHVARAIYGAAFAPSSDEEVRREKPSPGWCWEKTSDQMRGFAMKQAAAALLAIETFKR